MTAWRPFVICLGLLAVLALAAPAVTFAQGGGSAGDNQYVDPLGGSSSNQGSSHHSSGSGSSSSSGSSQSSSPSTSSPSSSSPAPTATSSSGSSDPGTTPTATIASSPPSSHQLPFTGFNSELAGALGVFMIAGGIGLRRLLQRRPARRPSE